MKGLAAAPAFLERGARVLGLRPPRAAAEAPNPIPRARRLRLVGSGIALGVTVRMTGWLSIPVIKPNWFTMVQSASA